MYLCILSVTMFGIGILKKLNKKNQKKNKQKKQKNYAASWKKKKVGPGIGGGR